MVFEGIVYLVVLCMEVNEVVVWVGVLELIVGGGFVGSDMLL